MGFFDGGIFDLNGDGRVSPEEEFMEFMYYSEVMDKKSKPDDGLEEFDDEDDDDF